ncbi:MAG: TlyA family RNA methyltransferase, partial [Spirochaetales bacterium]
DPALLKTTLENVYEALSKDGVGIFNATVSPIKGHKGNTEFLALLKGGPGMDCKSFLEHCGV